MQAISMQGNNCSTLLYRGVKCHSTTCLYFRHGGMNISQRQQESETVMQSVSTVFLPPQGDKRQESIRPVLFDYRPIRTLIRQAVINRLFEGRNSQVLDLSA